MIDFNELSKEIPDVSAAYQRKSNLIAWIILGVGIVISLFGNFYYALKYFDIIGVKTEVWRIHLLYILLVILAFGRHRIVSLFYRIFSR